MPYIKKEDRERLDGTYNDPIPQFAGELNYKITEMINNYIIEKGENYQTYNDLLGALEGAKLELYRRKIVPYEDIKRELNGDVY